MGKLRVGTRYFVHTANGSRFRGRYMGKDVYGRHQFDLRPDHGTTTVSPHDILHAEETKRSGA